jgi:uncharacterized protein YggE
MTNPCAGRPGTALSSQTLKEPDVIRIRHLAAALALALATPACAHPPPDVVVHAGPNVQQRALTATGTATIAVSPDCADLTLSVIAIASRPADAFAKVRARQASVVAALDKLGVSGPDVTLSQLGIDPVYRYEDQQPVIDGYSAHITITATTRTFDQIGALMEGAADAGVSSMSTRFRRSDLEGLRKQVRDQALAAAQAKARETAATLGITLGAISGVSDASEGYLSSNDYFPTSGGGGGGLGGDVQPLTFVVTLTYDLA